MAVVDDRGRVFGRINLVDAVLLVVLLGMIPLAYGAYALFRTPPPTLRAVEPPTLQYAPNLRVTVRGENLRPYMRVSFNDQQGRSFLFASTTAAEVELGGLSPGTYDVVLYDYAQERSRLPKALTITPPPLPSTMVVLVGMLANLPEGIAGQVAKGMSVGAYGQALSAGKPVPELTRVHVGDGVVDIPVKNAFRVPITFDIGCNVQATDGRPECIGAAIALRPDAYLLLETPFGRWPFQINQIRSPLPLEPLEAAVRIVGHPAALALIRPGDIDLGLATNELAAGARVMHAGGLRRLPGAAVTLLSASQALVADELATLDVTLLLQVQNGAEGWTYSGDVLRAGGPFLLRTRGYELRGSIVRLTPAPGAPAR